MDIRKLAVVVAGGAVLVAAFALLRDRAGADATESGATRIHATVRDGAVVGGVRRVTVPRGRRVEIVVDAPGGDRVHVHGYERFVDVRPGGRAEVAFRAGVPGSFDVELEERRILLVRLDVTP